MKSNTLKKEKMVNCISIFQSSISRINSYLTPPKKHLFGIQNGDIGRRIIFLNNGNGLCIKNSWSKPNRKNLFLSIRTHLMLIKFTPLSFFWELVLYFELPKYFMIWIDSKFYSKMHLDGAFFVSSNNELNLLSLQVSS